MKIGEEYAIILSQEKGDNMPKLDFDILDISQIDSPYTLEIFKKGCAAKQTDLVSLLGGDGSYNAYNGDSPSNIVLFDGTIHHYCRE